MDLDLNGKTALVCGSSRGIGQGIALELSKLGCRIICVARSEAGLEKTLGLLSKNSNHQAISCDMSSPHLAAKKVAETMETTGPGHILINNTGGPKPGPVGDASDEEFEEAFRCHVLASSALAKTVLPGMKEAGYGRIINIISTSVRIPIPGLGVSNTIRGAMASWAKTLSNEVASFGITVNNILPGATETDRLKSVIESRGTTLGQSFEEAADQWRESIPAKRFGTVEELASVAAFLASPAAAFVNGVSLPVDGGRTGCI